MLGPLLDVGCGVPFELLDESGRIRIDKQHVTVFATQKAFLVCVIEVGKKVIEVAIGIQQAARVIVKT